MNFNPYYYHPLTLPLPVPVPVPPPFSSSSTDYIDTAYQSSQKITSPSSLRKLLVLDLNGTLVYRSPHNPRRPRNQPHVSDPYPSTSSSTRPLRVVHPRPYMRSFREYLFHPRTREWLDTMVWSSAQPHSVDDMVDKTFGESKKHLVAVWARDTLGLHDRDYNRKTQTTKDLSKPWSRLSSTENDDYRHHHHRQQQQHSAYTTLLLDDSPHKAHLQPYNHLCIQEYDRHLRNIDLERLALEKRDRKGDGVNCASSLRGDGDVRPAPAPVSAVPVYIDGEEEKDADLIASSSTSSSDIPGLALLAKRKAEEKSRKKKLRRKRKRRDGVDQLGGAAETPDGSSTTATSLLLLSPTRRDPTAVPTPTPPPEQESSFDALELGYDTTLLAVVGVLETIKWESNVAAWVRTGGLAGPGEVEAQENGMAGLEGWRDGVGERRGRRNSRRDVQMQREWESLLFPTAQVDDTEETNTLGDTGQWQWFQDGNVMVYWVGEGVRALRELGVEVCHGLVR